MSWISDIWDEIWEPAREGLGEWFANMYHIKLHIFNIDFDSENMTSTIKSITDWDNVQNFGSEGITIYDIGQTINSFIVPIGLSLLVIFFMIHLIKQTQEIEKVTWERIALWACQFFILRMLIVKSYDLSTYIMRIVNEIYTDIGAGLNIDVAKGLDESFKSAFSNMGGIFFALISVVLYVILLFPFIGTVVQIWAQLILRVVKIMFCMSFSPIPVALAIDGETYRGKAVQYIMYTAGVGLEGILILVGSYIYSLGMNSLTGVAGENLNAIGHIVGILIMNSLFIAVIQLSHEFSDRLFGR